MPKIAIIGAGSVVFAKTVITDMLTYPALSHSQIALMYIDPGNLGTTEKIARRILAAGKYPATVTATTNRVQAVRGADFVIIMIQVGGYKTMRSDFRIGAKYGVTHCIGDTMGPGGIFRAQRTIPVLAGLVRDVEKHAQKNCLVLNYSNPMAMLCLGLFESGNVPTVGLCHSVQNTVHDLARYLNVPPDELDHWMAGINHQAWVLKLSRKGEDLYPLLRRRVGLPEVYRQDIVRCELCRQLGYFVTESSGHNSEYNPWFRKRPDLEARYCSGPAYAGETNYLLSHYDPKNPYYRKQLEILSRGKGVLDLGRSQEYCSGIINAVCTGEPYHFNGNVRNDGLIENLPGDCCVEVPCYADATGVHPARVGELPLQLGALNRANVDAQRLAARAALTADAEMVYHAMCYDPLVSAVCSLHEIREMTADLMAAYPEYLPKYRNPLRRTPHVLKFDYEKYKRIHSRTKDECLTEMNFIDNFWVVGPFDCTSVRGWNDQLDAVFGPEEKVDLLAGYKIGRSRVVRWRPVTRAALQGNGYLDFIRLFGALTDCVVYAVAGLRSGSNRRVRLLVGSDDGVAVWLNGRKVLHRTAQRSAAVDQDGVDLALTKGANTVLFKVDQKIGTWGLFARLKHCPSDVRVLSPDEIKSMNRRSPAHGRD